MTESENSQPQDESDEDIYKDIPEFNFEDELAKLEGSKETYKQEANDLSEKVKALTEENKELKKSNEVLKKNLSTLLKTAQAEIQRKDSMIEELTAKVESFTFRRNKNITKDKYTSTEDLRYNSELHFKSEKQKSVSDKKKRRLHENRTSSESEQKSIQKEEKKKDPYSRKEDNSDCDNDKKSNYKENSKTNFRHSDSRHDTYDRDRHKDRKSGRFEDNSGYRRPYRENHRDHLKYDSFDKKRHSRSSDNRFLSRRRNSRERRDDRRKDDSSERKRRSGESSERSRRRNSRKDRSRSREISRGSKESSLEKPKSRSSLDKDSAIRMKEQISTKPEASENIRSGTDILENKKQIENEKRTSLEDEVVTDFKSKQMKEKRSGKQEKRSGLDVFTAKSPLDTLYNDMVSSRSSNRIMSSKPATILLESDLEDGELSRTVTPNDNQNSSESQPEEDWILSFKNERKNESKPMTLYSRRMMRKFSSEFKSAENKEEKEKELESKKVEKIEVEKEPGELTDDENIVESSKEFQELTKVASIESEIIEKSAKEKTFKEPFKKEFSKLDNPKTEPLVSKENQKELEKSRCMREESSGCKEIELNKDIHEVMEFSPFKNNYRLIEISPIKSSSAEHVLDFYNQRLPLNQPYEQNFLTLSDGKSSSEKSSLKPLDTSEEKDSWRNSSSEKDLENELKIIVPSVTESPEKDDKKTGKKEERETKKRKKAEDKKLNVSNEANNSEKRKRRSGSNQETEKLVSDNKCQKRKRKSSGSDLAKADIKKRKIKENERPRKRTRTKGNSKTEPDCRLETEPDSEIKAEEDVSSFEFFKPTAKLENSMDVDKFVCTSADYKMTATMSVTGVVRLETPNKCVEKLKNLMINEHMIFNVLDSKNSSQFSPLIGSKCTEMTPRRMLKNDLMLTDSEDDTINKRNEEKGMNEEIMQEEMEEEEDEMSGSENSECDSDSGASDFVDLL